MVLFRWGQPARPEFTAPLTPDSDVIVLGDLHGRADLFDDMRRKLQAQAPATARLVCVGDYIDRGDDSAALLRNIMALQDKAPEGAVVCLMGNHEQMLLDFLDMPEKVGPHWMRYGGRQTLASFQVRLAAASAKSDQTRNWGVIRDALRATMGPKLEAWLRALPLSWQSGNLFVSHAGADPARRIHDQEARDLLWGRSAFYETPRRDGIWVAHGHVITSEAQVGPGRIPVDTGAYATGRLTAALIKPMSTGHRVHFITT